MANDGEQTDASQTEHTREKKQRRPSSSLQELIEEEQDEEDEIQLSIYLKDESLFGWCDTWRGIVITTQRTLLFLTTVILIFCRIAALGWTGRDANSRNGFDTMQVRPWNL